MNKFAMLLLTAVLSAAAAEPALKVSVLENSIVCIRASRVSDNFWEQFQAARTTNKISGTILDLRYADGEKTVIPGNIVSDQLFPMVILVNRQTQGAAGSLATRLQTARAGIVIGGTNSIVSPDITLSVNSAEEKLFLENPYFTASTNPTVSLSVTSSLLPFVDHMSEAELVRKKIKDGEGEDSPATAARIEPATPVIRDPALARAVDLLKALAILPKQRG